MPAPETEFEGAKAIKFTKDCLREVRRGNWEIEYEDPVSGERWLLDYPHGEMHGGGPPRLRELK